MLARLGAGEVNSQLSLQKTTHMTKIFIGIDPGAHGALVWIDDNGSVICHNTSKTLPFDAAEDASSGTERIEECVAYLEKVGGFIAGKRLPGSMMFKLGESFGEWKGLLAGLRIRCVLVRPQDWQAGITGLHGKAGPDRKRALRAEAARRFPTVKVTLDNCDALLIADYARRLERGRP